jgi:hypothetical protein
MAAKKASSKKSNLDVAVDAVEGLLALAAVVEQLAKAPKPALEWAARLKAEGALAGKLSLLRERVGQSGLQRRVAAVREGVELALPFDNATGRLQLLAQIERLERAVQVAGGFPILKRKQAFARIDRELDMLERGLVDALLPSQMT